MDPFLPSDYRIILDLGVLLIVALSAAAIFKRLGMPSIVGMLVAGIIIGPFTPGFQIVSSEIMVMGEIGAILILFGTGLQFSHSSLEKFGAKGFLLATFGGLATFAAGAGLGLLFGWSFADTLLLGVLFMSTSTATALKLMDEIPHVKNIKAELLTKTSIVADDLVGLFALAIVLARVGGTGSDAEIGLSIFVTILSIVIIFILGVKAMPKVTKFIEKVFPGNAFVFGISFCLILSYGVVALGVSPLIGAFLAGTILTSTLTHKDVLKSLTPIMNLFATVFFVSVGLLIDPYLLITQIPLALLISAVAMLSKALAISVALMRYGARFREAFSLGMFTGPRGEISLVIAQTASLAGLVQPLFLTIATSLVLFTAILSPLFLTYGPLSKGKAKI